MKTRTGRIVALLILAGSLQVVMPGLAAATGRDQDVLARLRALPRVTVVAELPSGRPGYRFFRLTFRQPADHWNPGSGTFEQRVTLMDTGTARPSVLYTTGFMLSDQPFLAEPTALVGGNQISVEERFFGASIPDPADWSTLNIRQAAADHHDLLGALRRIYRGPWVSTGAPGKGGMTTVYHRRFYPNDVAGSVVYSAANDVDNSDNTPYDRFFATVGPADCRRAIEAIQRTALIRRAEFVPRYAAYAAQKGYTFEVMRDPDRAWEGHVRDTEWGFWQNHDVSDCAKVPPATASTDVIWRFFLELTDPSWYTDQFLGPYMPFYYQALTQLGWPQPSSPHLADLRRYPDDFTPRDFVPAPLRTRPFDGRAMPDIDHWVRTAGTRLVFLYGGNDPYGVKPFRLGPGTRDSLWYAVPGAGTMRVSIQALPERQRRRVVADLRRWTGSPESPVRG